MLSPKHKSSTWGWKYSLVVEYLSTLHEVLGLIHSTVRKKEKKKEKDPANGSART
jgi:hypothetical protein